MRLNSSSALPAALLLSAGLLAPGQGSEAQMKTPAAEKREVASAGSSTLTFTAKDALLAPPEVVGQRGGVPVYQRQLLSPVYTVDRIYRSMTGPQSTKQFPLLPGQDRELLWIVGYEATMVAPDGETPMPQDFMCHSNLDFDPHLHNQLFGDQKRITSRLFTLSQGQLAVDLPEGFGIPILSTEDLSLTTQVLNLNLELEGQETIGVRHKVTVRFIRDRDLEKPLQPLFAMGVYGLTLLGGKDGYFGLQGMPDQEQHGPGCLPGQNAAGHEYRDAMGRRFTGHWVVPPGREENHTLVTHQLNLPFDTTVHYIAVHLHPFAEVLELRDLTTGGTVWASQARQFEGRIGLDRVDVYSDPKGIPLFRDHQYELVSIYNNTSGREQDSMAVMNLYLLDKEFRHPFRGAEGGDAPPGKGPGAR